MRHLFAVLVASAVSISAAGAAAIGSREAEASGPKIPATLCVQWEGGVQSVFSFKKAASIKINGGTFGATTLTGVHVGSIPFSLFGSAYLEGTGLHFSFTLGATDLGFLVSATGAGTFDLVTRTGSLSYQSIDEGKVFLDTTALTAVDCATVVLHPDVGRGGPTVKNLITNR